MSFAQETLSGSCLISLSPRSHPPTRSDLFRSLRVYMVSSCKNWPLRSRHKVPPLTKVLFTVHSCGGREDLFSSVE